MNNGHWEDLDRLCAQFEPAAIKVRRQLHRHPELSWEERSTQAYLLDWLQDLGLSPVAAGDTGLYVDIGEGAEPVIYRADLDALPIQDGKQIGQAPCVSEVAGVSHACGHDVHTAVAAGLAASLTALKDTLPGRVRIVFQPAEEVIPSGGNALLSEGVLKDARAALALHCDPTRDVGTVGVRVGPLTSTADAFHIEVIGEAGHAARPHLARDAIAASAAVVQALYGLVSRRVSPVEPAVLTVGYIEGGVAENVLADRVRMGGNLRTVDEHTRLRLQRELREVAQASASIHGCAVEVQFKLGAPPIRNDKHLHGYVCDSANEVLGSQGVQVVADPSTGAEDFGFYSMATRIYMMRLGVHTPGKEVFHLHTPAFNPDERSIGYAMRIMGRALIRILSAPYEADAG